MRRPVSVTTTDQLNDNNNNLYWLTEISTWNSELENSGKEIYRDVKKTKDEGWKKQNRQTNRSNERNKTEQNNVK